MFVWGALARGWGYAGGLCNVAQLRHDHGSILVRRENTVDTTEHEDINTTVRIPYNNSRT